MKLVRVQSATGPRLGFIDGTSVVDPDNDPLFRDPLVFIQSGERGRRAAETAIRNAPASARQPLASAKLLAPLVPSTILCSGSNYTDHNAEKANTPISGKEPEFFVKTADCVVGPDEPIAFDERFSKKIDCEVELAIVIGKPGRFIDASRALEHVFGYTIVNDVTARDRQVRRNEQEIGRASCRERVSTDV